MVCDVMVCVCVVVCDVMVVCDGVVVSVCVCDGVGKSAVSAGDD